MTTWNTIRKAKTPDEVAKSGMTERQKLLLTLAIKMPPNITMLMLQLDMDFRMGEITKLVESFRGAVGLAEYLDGRMPTGDNFEDAVHGFAQTMKA